MQVQALNTREIGARILAARTFLGVSQEALSRSAGISWKTVSRLEKGLHAANAATINAIAQALGVTTDWLLTGEGDGPGVHGLTMPEDEAAREVCG